MKIISLVVGLTVGVLLMVGLVSPIVADGQTNMGDPITYTNVGAANGGSIFEEIGSDTITYTISNGVISLNGTPLTWALQAYWGNIIYTDGGQVLPRSSLDQVQFITLNKETNTADVVTVTVPTEGLTITVSNNTVTLGENSFTFTKGYYWSETADSDKYFLALDLTVRAGTWYVKSLSDLITYGIYSTGENDCYYELINGKLTVDEDYTTAVNATLTKVEGTTDIYQLTNFTLGVGEETFTPYLCLIPGSVTGHATSGANYALLKAIPIVAFIALIAFAAFAVRGRMND